MDVHLDIETIPSQKPGILSEIRQDLSPPGNISKAETIAKWWAESADSAALEQWLKTSFDGSRGELVVVGFAVGDGGVASRYRNLGESEGDLLQAAFDDLDALLVKAGASSAPRFVGHNIISFDLRFLYQRAVILGIKPPFLLPTETRYNGDLVFDTMLAWAGWGNRIPLVRLCEALGIKVKSGGIDGSKVWEYVQAGRVQEVAGYCEEDVFAGRQVAKRLQWEV
jgi:hypothetical protein